MREASESNNNYDIYINPTPYRISSLADLDNYKHLLSLEATNRLLGNQYGFLGLNFQIDISVELYKRLHNLGVWGDVVPTKYRQPKIDIDGAYNIAKKEINRICSLDFPDITFNPIELYSDNSMTYTFSASSEELHELGWWEPDAVFAQVDKIDGHIWKRFEYFDYVVAIGLGEVFFGG